MRQRVLPPAWAPVVHGFVVMQPVRTGPCGESERCATDPRRDEKGYETHPKQYGRAGQAAWGLFPWPLSSSRGFPGGRRRGG
jgi:hypothetical protein